MAEDQSPTSEVPRLSVRDAFDLHYSSLLADLTALSGSTANAEAAVDEAFRQAASHPRDFLAIGRQRDWLLATARNHLLRRQYRRNDLDSDPDYIGGRLERPSLEASVRHAQAWRRQRLAVTVVSSAALLVVLTGLAVATFIYRPDSGAGVSTANRTATSSTGPDTTVEARPTIAWPPTDPDTVIRNGRLTQRSLVPEDPGIGMSSYEWCRFVSIRKGEECVTAIELTDGAGNRSALLPEDRSVRYIGDGAFAIEGRPVSLGWGLIRPGWSEPKTFQVASVAIDPRPGQDWVSCEVIPAVACILDPSGTLTHIRLPKVPFPDPPGVMSDVSWQPDTSRGWVGVGNQVIVLQDEDFGFTAVPYDGAWAAATVAVAEDGTIAAALRPYGEPTVMGLAVAVSTDRGRTWQFRVHHGEQWFDERYFPKGWRGWSVLPQPQITFGEPRRL